MGLTCWPPQHPELQVQPFDEKVARHKARKYGRVDNVEVWGHRDSKFKYLMVINDDNQNVFLSQCLSEMSNLLLICSEYTTSPNHVFIP